MGKEKNYGIVVVFTGFVFKWDGRLQTKDVTFWQNWFSIQLHSQNLAQYLKVTKLPHKNHFSFWDTSWTFEDGMLMPSHMLCVSFIIDGEGPVDQSAHCGQHWQSSGLLLSGVWVVRWWDTDTQPTVVLLEEKTFFFFIHLYFFMCFSSTLNPLYSFILYCIFINPWHFLWMLPGCNRFLIDHVIYNLESRLVPWTSSV